MNNQEVKNLSQASAGYAANMGQIVEQAGAESDLKELLEKNLKYAKAIYWSTEKIRHYIFWQRVFSFLKLLIIVVPIILAAIYLPPYLKSLFEPYLSLIQE